MIGMRLISDIDESDFQIHGRFTNDLIDPKLMEASDLNLAVRVGKQDPFGIPWNQISHQICSSTHIL